jgi:hypothetical protein
VRKLQFFNASRFELADIFQGIQARLKCSLLRVNYVQKTSSRSLYSTRHEVIAVVRLLILSRWGD